MSSPRSRTAVWRSRSGWRPRSLVEEEFAKGFEDQGEKFGPLKTKRKGENEKGEKKRRGKGREDLERAARHAQ